MKRVAKWAGLTAAGLFGLLLLAAAVVFLISWRIIGREFEAKAETLAAPTAAMLADAPRQAKILGCVTCHGEGLKGQLMVEIPNVARVHAPNITAIAARSSDQQLAAAIRQGIGHDKRGLFVMPSPQYSRLSDGEVAALIAWIRSLPPVSGRAEGLQFGPLGRVAVAAGKFRQAPEKVEEFRTQAPIRLGAAHAAGQRLAANDCSECHGPALYGQQLESGETAPENVQIGTMSRLPDA